MHDLDFYRIKTTSSVRGPRDAKEVTTKVSAVFLNKSGISDLMVRGGGFYAVWNEDKKLWSRDPLDVVQIIDGDIREFLGEQPASINAYGEFLGDNTSGKWNEFQRYLKNLPDNWEPLDTEIIPMDHECTKEDHATRKLEYAIKKGDASAYDELMSVLYSDTERTKIEWCIGSVFAGKSKEIQKFLVLYGTGGTGKSTVINIMQDLFNGYWSACSVKSLTRGSNQFALSAFANDPLVALEHDGDLSRIQDNTLLNSLVAHETMVVNEKYRIPYQKKFVTFLVVGTNTPIRITDSRSGLLRRVIVAEPTGERIPFDRYRILMDRIKFEKGAIAAHCLSRFTELGEDYYENYRPTRMLDITNDVYNFLSYNYLEITTEGQVTLTQLYARFKLYCEDSGLEHVMPKRKFKEELRNYFNTYKDYTMVDRPDGSRTMLRSVFSDLDKSKFDYTFMSDEQKEQSPQPMLELNCTESIFDEMMKDAPAQYANDLGTPVTSWDRCKTKLSDIDTSRLHYVRVPENHIVIDFDITDDTGTKSMERNLTEAAKWPSTYAEFSKSGKGVHLHYIYDGDPKQLASVYSEHIEIKVFSGKSSLRRRLTMCNDKPVAHISGLPLGKKKGEEKVMQFNGLRNEKALRTFISRNLRKEYHPGTKPSVEFIASTLDDFKKSGKRYDIRDLRPRIYAFASNSTHHADYCKDLVKKMPFVSEGEQELDSWGDAPIMFFDVEVFSNLFVIVAKEPDKNPVRMINPTPSEVEALIKNRLIGFNNRKYDNHILYARMLGYSNEQLYKLSYRIVHGSHTAMFRDAYNLSYADIYDYSSKKQSLKKFEIELGIHHQELGLPWDEPVSEDLWNVVADYCVNDVVATEAVFNATQVDFHAREMLANLSGLTVNDTNRMHSTRIIFGNDRHPQDKFVYTDLSEMFPGYSYEVDGKGKVTSHYRGEEPGEGGYVYSEPGIYEHAALLDIASMHPNSLIQLNLFGPYTKRFKELLDARIAVKHKEYDKAAKLLDGKLAPYLGNPEDSAKLAQALKIIVNSVYGLTTANFNCEFKDPRNVDNIVAKRGALFMINLKHEVQKRGFTVAHIKTDSIKIPNATPEIIKFVQDYGKKYGYTFEHEATFEKVCLVNDAVYVCKVEEGKEHDAGPGEWAATGKQFQVPYVFKTLFSHEDLKYDDFTEIKSVTGESSIFLDFDEDLPEGDHNYTFIGRVGQFTPVVSGKGGGRLYREKGGKYYALSGSKGYRWLESETVAKMSGSDNPVDISYFEKQAEKAKATISKYGDFDEFVS